MNRLPKRLCNPSRIIARSFCTSDVLSAKVVTTSGYRGSGSTKRTNKIGAGPLYGDGEQVKRGQIVWNNSTKQGFSWGCLPG